MARKSQSKKSRVNTSSPSKKSDKLSPQNSNVSSIVTKVDQESPKPTKKKRRYSDVEEPLKYGSSEFIKQEKEWDDLLPEKYKRYRPKGFPLNLPKDPDSKHFRVYCDGIYDLFHLGHMNQLKQCKEVFPNVSLVVGVPADEVTWKNKGLTVLTDKQRCETLLHCKWVDEVIPDAPWSVTPKFLEDHKLDFVAHDDIPYASADSDDVYAPVKKLGKFIVTQRTEGISTSDIITKIIRDYDKYLLRNFARGASRHDLNVSWFKKNELELKKHIKDFRQYWKKTNKNLNNASKDLYCEVREYMANSSNALKRINSSPSLSSLANDKRSTSPTFEPLSPATEFAMKFSGNKNNQPRSIIQNFKKWMFKKDFGSSGSELNTDSKETSPDSEYTNEDDMEAEQQPQRKRQKL